MAKIDSVRVKGVKPIVQDYSTTCWFAAFQMLYKWQGKPIKQVAEKIINHQTPAQKKADPPICDMNYMWSNGIGKADLIPCSKALNLSFGGGSQNDIRIGPLMWLLDKYGPVWIAGKWNAASHVVVLVAARRAKVPMVNFLNPWRQFGGRQEIERPLSWLNKGRGAWKTANASLMYRSSAIKNVKIDDYLD